MKPDTFCCCCISKHMTKKGIAESLPAYITRIRLTMCEVGILSVKMSEHLKFAHPFFEELLILITLGHIFERLWYMCVLTFRTWCV